MGQANNSGRNASLDQHKRRSAGRQNTNSPEKEAIRDPGFTKGKTKGAFGKDGHANTPPDAGGGKTSKARNSDAGMSTKSARKRS